MFTRKIRLSDWRGRSAVVGLASCRMPVATSNDEPKRRHVRLIKHDLETTPQRLLCRYGDGLAQALMDGDPEISFDAVGMETGICRRVYLDAEDRPLYSAKIQERVFAPTGEETHRGDAKYTPANLMDERPWSGKLIPVEQAARRFAFTRKYAVRHVDPLTYDFLHAMSAWLMERKSLVVVGSGVKGTGPLILERGSIPLTGLLGGEVNGVGYRLILHLADFELKRPAPCS